jgi:hypothetical protein
MEKAFFKIIFWNFFFKLVMKCIMFEGGGRPEKKTCGERRK